MTEPVTTATAIVATAIKSAATYLPGAVGAAFSLKFLGADLTLWQKATSFGAGLACAGYVAPAAIEFWHIPGEHVPALLEFLVGLFALAVVRELFVEINSADLIGTLKRRFLGSEK